MEDSGKVSEGIDARLEYVKREEQYYPESGRESSIGLGYRVPMVIASPWSRGGWVNSQVFDRSIGPKFCRYIFDRIQSVYPSIIGAVVQVKMSYLFSEEAPLFVQRMLLSVE